MDLTRAIETVTSIGESGRFTMVPILAAVADDFLVRYFPKYQPGKTKVALAVTEERAGSNLFEIKTEVRGDILSGEKIYISGADVADRLFVVAKIKDEFCVLWLDPRLEGVSIQPMDVWGESDIHPCRVTFRDVSFTEDSVVAKGKKVLPELFSSFNIERILIAHQMLGIARYCIRISVEAANNRKVFGDAAIGAYQGVQYPLADVKIRETALSELLKATDQGNAFYANSAKYLAVELGQKALDAATTALGARAFDRERGLQPLLEAVQLLKAAPIGNNLVLNYVAQAVLKLPKGY